MSEKDELMQLADEAELATIGAQLESTLPTIHNDWPAPMAEEAFYGLAGDFVHAVEPETEADPVGLLVNFLIAAGVLFGREAWAKAEGKRHYPVEYGVLIGATG